MKLETLKFSVALMLAFATALPSFAQSQMVRNSQAASAGLSIAAGSVVAGTSLLIAAGSILTIEAVEHVGDSVVVVLKGIATGASEASTVSVKVSASAVGNASLVAGKAVNVVAEASGYALYLAGKLIAFIPNEIGKTLVHHSEFREMEK